MFCVLLCVLFKLWYGVIDVDFEWMFKRDDEGMVEFGMEFGGFKREYFVVVGV